MIMYIRTLC